MRTTGFNRMTPALAALTLGVCPALAQPLVYLADFGADVIHALDRRSGALVRSIPAPGSFSTGLEIFEGDLLINNYTGCGDDRLYRVDATSGDIIDSYPSPDCPVDGLALDPSGAYLLALAPEEEQLVIVEPLLPALDQMPSNAELCAHSFVVGAPLLSRFGCGQHGNTDFGSGGRIERLELCNEAPERCRKLRRRRIEVPLGLIARIERQPRLARKALIGY